MRTSVTPADFASSSESNDSQAIVLSIVTSSFVGKAISSSVHCDEDELARMENIVRSAITFVTLLDLEQRLNV
jgi:hypothetical protein